MAELSWPTLAASGIRLDSLALDEPIVLASDATLQTAAQAMGRSGRRAVLVGSWTVVTETDVSRAVATGRAPTTLAAAIARLDPVVVSRDATLLEALTAMLRGSRAECVVVDSGWRVVAVAELADVVAHAFGDPLATSRDVVLDDQLVLDDELVGGRA
jgi:CBS domain-containing protein